MGAPGWPELACWTASIANARIALAIEEVLAMVFGEGEIRRYRGNPEF
jgi:hypothetical protein